MNPISFCGSAKLVFLELENIVVEIVTHRDDVSLSGMDLCLEIQVQLLVLLFHLLVTVYG